MKTITFGKNIEYLEEAIARFRVSSSRVALTGAGISVNSGIPDFRSPGGVWTMFSPEEYGTLKVFQKRPAKAWQLYRALGKTIEGKKPNRGHLALARLETEGLLNALVTQNVDTLHQAAGNTNVLEIHGDHQHLQCLQCGNLVTANKNHYSSAEIPTCNLCDYPFKPNVVLFGEAVRSLDEIQNTMSNCSLLLVIGTSAQVYPAADFPKFVKQGGGLIYEFNKEPALGSHSSSQFAHLTDYFFEGDLSTSLPQFTRDLIGK